MRNEKSQLRRELREKLAGFPPAQRLAASRELAPRLVVSPQWKNARVIGLFAGLSDEMETSFLWAEESAREKTFVYPRIDGDELHFLVAESPADLTPGKWHVHEPSGDKLCEPDLVLVPGLGFDSSCNRIGRGKGFYDRFIASHPDIFTLGVCFDFQIVPQIPVEAHDRPMNAVLTERRNFP